MVLARMSELVSEMWLAQRMLDHRGPDVFDGTTDKQSRMLKFRNAIKECGLACVVIGSKDKKPVNWREAFEQIYGVPL